MAEITQSKPLTPKKIKVQSKSQGSVKQQTVEEEFQLIVDKAHRNMDESRRGRHTKVPDRYKQ